jgi:hypothetical protein
MGQNQQLETGKHSTAEGAENAEKQAEKERKARWGSIPKVISFFPPR